MRLVLLLPDGRASIPDWATARHVWRQRKARTCRRHRVLLHRSVPTDSFSHGLAGPGIGSGLVSRDQQGWMQTCRAILQPAIGEKRPTMSLPVRQGLYDPRNEHDACGVGFVVNIKGRKSHEIISRGLKILENLDHRGAVGADPLVGDGAGCLIQMPDRLLRDWAEQHDLTLPPLGRYAVAMCFLQQDANARDFAIRLLEHYVAAEGQTLLGWREVPTDTTGLGKRVIETMPVIRQAIV